MTDRELLELAAKAAGIEIIFTESGLPWLASGKRPWNPLTDDGDALRLLVTLREHLCLDAAAMLGCGNFDAWKADPYAATRRAIVRVAAEIGRNMT